MKYRTMKTMRMYTISWKDAENNNKYVKVVTTNVLKAIEFAVSKGATLESIDYLNTAAVDVIE